MLEPESVDARRVRLGLVILLGLVVVSKGSVGSRDEACNKAHAGVFGGLCVCACVFVCDLCVCVCVLIKSNGLFDIVGLISVEFCRLFRASSPSICCIFGAPSIWCILKPQCYTV